MPASSAKNKGEQGFLFMYKLDVIVACVMQEAHTHHQQQHLVVQEMTDLYSYGVRVRERDREEINHGKNHKKERRAAHLASLQSGLQGNQSEGRASVTCATGLITRHDFL
jgi:hypothetical protein